ncbi:hypothetical protein [Sphingomonas sp.]|uniref:hypothetical protein n=1 Tax=Sphingomonas sp. TaxID=28214 RepID=UPI002BE00541|nr:hypothetical protein [Sphingomonas sp.]HWK34830.1 hypothetical protein [Sphingomonas sp.]
MTDRIRLDLASRIDAIGFRARHVGAGDLADELEQIRRIAVAQGIRPAVTVVHAILSALGRGERGPLVDGWLAILRDAIGCESNDARTCEAFAAACTVRLGA